MKRLFVFDLDGTLNRNPEFYTTVYSRTLEQLIKEFSGDEGMTMLAYFRQACQGRGELALSALNIPFSAWAKRLCAAPLELIVPQPDIVAATRSLSGKKVVYTGSPTYMAHAMLAKLGYLSSDFDDVIGWREPETCPVKWTCTSRVFLECLRRYKISPTNAYSIGDNWNTDLLPAKSLGMRTIIIGSDCADADLCFSDVLSFVEHVTPNNRTVLAG
ncbi:MAG: HAD family hydrolase [bacterium]|nr:HAD family hydrolase [bacterium]MDZ4347331.1 HAD family hydrolase [Candidatus Binatia bacterium]